MTASAITVNFRVLLTPSAGLPSTWGALREAFEPHGFEIVEGTTERLDLPLLLDPDVTFEGPPSGEQIELYSQGSPVPENEAVIYFVRNLSGVFGVATHPPGLAAAIVAQDADRFAAAHELGHLLGLTHVFDDRRLMFTFGTFLVTESPPRLVETEVETIGESELVTEP